MGLACLIGAVTFLLIPGVSGQQSTTNPWAAPALGVFFLLVGGGCIPGLAGHVSLRLASALVFSFAIWCVRDDLRGGDIAQGLLVGTPALQACVDNLLNP